MIISQEQYQHYKKNQGYVYLIHAKGTNRYKIGRSINPLKRHEQLQGQSPFPLIVENCVWSPDSILLEKQLHDRFCDFRVYGEWFEFEDGKYLDLHFFVSCKELFDSEVVNQIFDCLWQESELYCKKHSTLDIFKQKKVIESEEDFVDNYAKALLWSIRTFLSETNELNKFVLKTTYLVSFLRADSLLEHLSLESREDFLGSLYSEIVRSFEEYWQIFEQGYDMGLKQALVVRTVEEDTTVDESQEKGGKQ